MCFIAFDKGNSIKVPNDKKGKVKIYNEWNMITVGQNRKKDLRKVLETVKLNGVKLNKFSHN